MRHAEGDGLHLAQAIDGPSVLYLDGFVVGAAVVAGVVFHWTVVVAWWVAIRFSRA